MALDPPDAASQAHFEASSWLCTSSGKPSVCPEATSDAETRKLKNKNTFPNCFIMPFVIGFLKTTVNVLPLGIAFPHVQAAQFRENATGVPRSYPGPGDPGQTVAKQWQQLGPKGLYLLYLFRLTDVLHVILCLVFYMCLFVFLFIWRVFFSCAFMFCLVFVFSLSSRPLPLALRTAGRLPVIITSRTR